MQPPRLASNRFTVAVFTALLLTPVGFTAPASGQSAGEGPVQGRNLVAPAGHQLDLPFSPAMETGDFLYLSGALGNKPGTVEVKAGDIAAQSRQMFDNLEAVLAAGGSSMSRVVDADVFVSDARFIDGVMAVYSKRLPEPRPAGLVVEADIAIPGALAEVAMVAARPGVEILPVNPADWPKLGVSSHGVLAGDTLFLSAMMGYGPDTLGDPGQQIRRALQNMGVVLDNAGMDYSNVVSCRVFLADARSFKALNDIYPSFFPSPPPARATMRAALASPELEAVIKCIAVAGERRAVLPEGAKPRATLSPAIATEDRLFLSGMVGRDANGKFPPDVSEQTRLVLGHLKATLEADGLGWEDVVSANVYLTDIRHYALMNAVYAETVGTPAPARATVGTQLMSPDALVEIQMLATRTAPAKSGSE